MKDHDFYHSSEETNIKKVKKNNILYELSWLIFGGY